MKKIDILLRTILCFTLFSSISLSAQKKSTKPAAVPDKSTTSSVAEDTPKYKNPALPIDDRVADLLSRMTLEEKIGQIAPAGDNKTHVIDPTGTYDDDSASKVMNRWWDPDLEFTPRKSALLRNGVQRYNKEKTRLGIPELFMGEALHGFMEYGSTSFPQALSLASTWDPALVHEVFTAAGDEAGSRGVGQVFSPVLDIARDPRWGRTEETYGEDPFLASRMGVAAITGLQGESFSINRHHVVATAKHFAVHGQPEGGTNTAPGNYSERIIRENFLVPFQAAIEEAHAGSVMASYNEIDGVPSHINHWLLDKVLRQEWGFRGYVTSDGNGLQMLTETHHVAANSAEAARLALAAGVDYDLSDGSVYRTLLWQVKQGAVSEVEVDRAVARVLATKFRLGLFDNPYVDPDYAEKTTNSAEHRALALKTAQKAVILLKNDRNLLPLDLSKLKTIAVIGPNADGIHLGGYSREPAHAVSILQGIKDRVGTKANVVYAEGCKITDAKNDWHGWFANDVKLIDAAKQQDGVKAAAEAAKNADVAIVVVGENESTNREAWAENHLGDRDSLELLGAQNELVKAVVETGTPTVVLLINGRPLAINYIAEKVPAILEGWYLGQEGGTAAANVIFGDVNPGGKLPITFPHSVGDLPDFYNHKPSANRTYAFSTRKPLFPFGYGLSYTTFAFSNLRVEPAQILSNGSAKVSVDVTNSGSREGDEVPQLYIHQRVASITQPVMQLKAFQRLTLKPGEKKTVEFIVTSDMLSMLNVDMHRVVEPGVFDVMVGPSSDQTNSVKLTVTGLQGESGKPLAPPPPAGSESGVVSTFDDGKVAANFGSWMVSTDAMNGGKSTAAMQVAQPGANNSKGALQVTGEIMPGAQFTWAGAMFSPGSAPMAPANLSSKKGISFWAKGDGKTYTLVVLTEARSGQNGMPAMTQFVAGPEWKQYSFPFTTFETDGGDLTSFVFVATQPSGKFAFELDELEIK
ncbi:MAG TPA: CIA30 family protein [Candidatus Dormibacteraeota bacterium]|nr:CIA30 family protein [Candidatus Dormibacteraeota bacterium]